MLDAARHVRVAVVRLMRAASEALADQLVAHRLPAGRLAARGARQRRSGSGAGELPEPCGVPRRRALRAGDYVHAAAAFRFRSSQPLRFEAVSCRRNSSGESFQASISGAVPRPAVAVSVSNQRW